MCYKVSICMYFRIIYKYWSHTLAFETLEEYPTIWNQSELETDRNLESGTSLKYPSFKKKYLKKITKIVRLLFINYFIRICFHNSFNWDRYAFANSVATE